MPVTENYLNYVLDLLDGVGAARRMFGGAGLYLNGLFFGLIADEVLYFKVDESNKNNYVEDGMEPFSPFGTYTMSYYQVPPAVLEDGAQLSEWAQKSLSAAAGSPGTKKKKTMKKG